MNLGRDWPCRDTSDAPEQYLAEQPPGSQPGRYGGVSREREGLPGECRQPRRPRSDSSPSVGNLPRGTLDGPTQPRAAILASDWLAWELDRSGRSGWRSNLPHLARGRRPGRGSCQNETRGPPRRNGQTAQPWDGHRSQQRQDDDSGTPHGLAAKLPPRDFPGPTRSIRRPPRGPASARRARTRPSHLPSVASLVL